MRKNALIRHGKLVSLLGAILWICSGCTTPGSKPPMLPVLVVGESNIVQLTEPNDPIVSNRPGVWMERGRYIELCEAEMMAISHGLIKR